MPIENFQALKIYSSAKAHSANIENLTIDALNPGEVLIKGHYSGINYKDALAVSGAGRILRKSPLIGGIDVSGIVEISEHPDILTGEKVLVCGCGLSESMDGGYAGYTRVPADCVEPLPESINLFEAMAIGSAGFTAALAVDRMEHNGQSPGIGPIAVTGATGGVGSYAIDLFSNRGYQIVAISSKQECSQYLHSLGAQKFLARQSMALGVQALEKAEWGGAVDNVGGDLLSWLTRSVNFQGNIACIGLAGGVEINTTVMPFILRGINLLGIDSVHCSKQTRRRIWQRLGTDLRPRHIEKIVNRVITLEEVPAAVDAYIHGQNSGRTVVNLL